MLTHKGDSVTTHRFAEAAEWGVCGAEDRHFWGSLCGPEINTQTPSSQIIRWSFNCQCQMVPWSLRRKANLRLKRRVTHDCMSAPSKHHISLVYGAVERRGEHLNAPVLKFHIGEGLFLFHSTHHIFCATRLLRVSHTTLQLWEGAHIKVQRDVKMKSSRCSLLWYYKLLLASHACILFNFNSCSRGFTTWFEGSKEESVLVSIFDKWLFINQANQGNLSMTLIYSSGALGRSTTFVKCCGVSDENIFSHNLSIWSKDEEKAKKQHQNLEVPDPLLQC